MKSKKMIAIIQARLGSKRLPSKVLLKIENAPMLYYVVRQVKASELIDDVIIATTNLPEDDKIIRFCSKLGLQYFRGSSEDVLDRYYKCAKKFKCDPVIRISADCPLIDPKVIDKTIKKFLKNLYDYVGTNLEKKNGKWINSTCNFPQGMAVEVASFKTLEKAWKKAKKPSEREHVFPYVQFNPHLFKVSNIKNGRDLSFVRCTVDRPEDLEFVRELYKRISKRKKIVCISDILKIVKNEPRLLKINNKIPFDEGYKKSLKNDFRAQK